MNERGYRMVFDGCTGLPSIAYDQLENHKDGTVIYNDHQKLTWADWHSTEKWYNINH